MVNHKIKSLLPQAIRLFKEHHVKQAYLFGSVLTDRFGNDSDVDIIVAFDEPYFDGYIENFFEMEDKLAKLFNRKIDITPESQIRNSVFKRITEQTREKIYG